MVNLSPYKQPHHAAVMSEHVIARLLGGTMGVSTALSKITNRRGFGEVAQADQLSEQGVGRVGGLVTVGNTLEDLFEIVERAKREWESAIDSLPDLVCLVDGEGKIIRANRTVEEWQLGQVETVRGLTVHQLIHPACDDSACYFEALRQEIAKQTVLPGELLNHEEFDPVLKRHIHVYVRSVLDRAQEPTNTTVVAVRDITERRLVELERERLISDLDAYARTVAHDLKNPVTLIVGYAELLKLNVPSLSTNELRECAQQIMSVGLKLDTIIEELLLFAEVQDTEAEIEPFDMGHVIAEALKRVQDLIARYEAEVITLPAWPVALGQPQWLEEVWVNYLSNALKYGGRPARVELGVDLQPDGMARFWVKDNGQGIKSDQRDELFTRRKRRRWAHSESHGLGLSIVQRIIEKLGGQVGVTSNEEPASGSTFFFTLPIHSPPH